ncbi:NAD(P)H-dependent oxidoreductase [Aquincola sp. MAHUQ-54]|uniref:NAD(P)H-dependent oxidoreductase n=1 Tax=Aquincola agrisoli TaxID=3119538 RepID=A0AAW9QC36_9BURK
MKTLVLVAHPNLETSRINKAWARALRRQPGVTVVDLAAKYPDHAIDILEEQALLLAHDRYVLQFPLYWYSSPPILKSWIDAVLQPGFAYAVGGTRLRGKEWMVSTSVGSTEDGYRAGGHNQFTVDEMLRPFQQTAAYTGGIYRSPYCFYRAMLATEADIVEGTRRMLQHVLRPGIDPEGEHERFVIDSLNAIFQRADETPA